MDGAGPDAAHGQAGDRQQPPSGPAPSLPTGRLDKPLRAFHSPWDNAQEERFAHLLGCPHRPQP